MQLVFEYSDSLTTGELFKEATQNIEQEFQKLFNYYDIGVNRLHDIYKQKIEKFITRNTYRRHMKNITTNMIS